MSNNDNVTLPPQDLEMERAVLGACLIAPMFEAVSEVLAEEDWYLTVHRQIFAAMRRLWMRQEPIDCLTVPDELARAGVLAEVGGRAKLVELSMDVVSGAQAVAHAKLLRELSLLRTLRNVGLTLQLDADAKKGAEAVAREVEQQLFTAIWQRQRATCVEHETVLHATLDQIELLQRTPGGNIGIATGLRELDRVLHGFQPSDLVIVAGRPGMGKTSLGMGVSLAAARQGKRVAVASLEMSTRQLGFRVLSMESGVSLHALTSGQLSGNQMSRVNWAAVNMAPLPIHYADANPLSVEALRAMVRQLKIHNGLDLVIVDYLQLMENPNRRRGGRQEDVAEISRGLKLMAKELDLCVVALSQLSRKPEERTDRRPMLADLRESGAIEQDADVVLMLYRDEVYDKDSTDRGIAEILIRKHRNGPTGDVRVGYQAECARFHDLTELA